MNDGLLTIDEYRKERRLAGVFGILSDLDALEQLVYEQYNTKEEIAQAFDAMKNELETDRTYLGRENSVRDYFLMVLLTLWIYFEILRRLREKDLVGKISVREALMELKDGDDRRERWPGVNMRDPEEDGVDPFGIFRLYTYGVMRKSYGI